MTRKLKTYQTSIGFFDLVIAAPSMKAALDSWGADSNLFHQGFARETSDPAIVAAATAHPGVVLRRPVGTDDAFMESSHLPKKLTDAEAPSPRRKGAVRSAKAIKVNDAAARGAAAKRERKQQQQKAEKRKEQLLETKARKRRAAQVARAEQAFDTAEKSHQDREAAIEADRVKLERRLDAERDRWEKHRPKLRDAILAAKSGD